MFPDSASLDRQYRLPVQIPTNVVEQFLRDLTAVAVADGPYRPIRVPDSRSHREFRIRSNAGTVRIFTDILLGPMEKPWAVEYGGRQMLIDSSAPWRAYGLIRPYFDEFRRQRTEEFREMNRALEPSPSPVPR